MSDGQKAPSRSVDTRLPLQRRTHAWWALAVLPSVAACSAPSSQTNTSDAARADGASATVQALQARKRAPARSLVAGRRRDADPGGAEPVLPASDASAVVRDGAWLRAVMPPSAASPSHPVEVRFPRRASGAVSITDLSSSVSVNIALQGASDAEAEISGGFVVYPAALRGAAVIQRPTVDGTEDYVVVDRPLVVPELRYSIGLGEMVAGLRLVSRTLELLDAGGAPRLRMAPPYAIDGGGKTVELDVSVVGCEVDTSPAAPWDRAVTLPGSTACELVVSWAGVERPRYPLVIDPAWTTTASMAFKRAEHGGTLLKDGRLLVSGGGGSGREAEVFNPSGAGSWASTGAMHATRSTHGLVTLANGKAIAVAGYGRDEGVPLSADLAPLSSCETYDAATGAWSLAASLAVPHWYHHTLALSDGRVLVAGGTGYESDKTIQVLASSGQGGWTTLAPLAKMLNKPSSTAVALADGRVFFLAGYENPTLYTPDNGGSSVPGPALPAVHDNHFAVRLPDGRVLIAGGSQEPGISTPGSTLIFDPAGAGSWATFPPMNRNRMGFNGAPGVVALSDGRVLVTAGQGFGYDAAGTPLGTQPLATSEVFSPAAGTWTPSAALSGARTIPYIAELQDGSVLLVGGLVGSTYLNRVERLAPSDQGQPCATTAACTAGLSCLSGLCCDLLCAGFGTSCLAVNTGLANGTCGPIKNGTTCTTDATCGSGHCMDNVCCDTACNTPCLGCTNAKKGSGPDGTCGPIAGNTDPDGDCQGLGAGTCQTSGLCDGRGACQSKLGMACGSGASCVPGTSSLVTGGLCTATGDCGAGGTIDCSPSGCSNGACRESCTSSADCAAEKECIGGKCRSGKSLGLVCTGNSDCDSGFCVDGVCCNKACNLGCQSCLAKSQPGGGQDGFCADAVAGSDPHDECAPAPGAEKCGPDGACDGKGACRAAASATTSCGPTLCVGPSVSGKLCNGTGTCVDGKTIVCAPYKCSTQANACLKACATSDDCVAGNFCQSGLCQPKLAVGKQCLADEACGLGHCVDGICCNTTCEGACVSCNGNATQSGIDGECGSVKVDTNPRNKCLKGGELCEADGKCGDDGQCRTATPAGTICGKTSCDGATETAKACDGFGKCEPATKQCAPFTCSTDGKSCRESCDTNEHCGPGNQCDPGTSLCGPGGSMCVECGVKNTAGSVEGCLGYQCNEGANACRTACETNAECCGSKGFVCENKLCVQPTEAGGAGGAGGTVGAAGKGATGGKAGADAGTGGVAGKGGAPSQGGATGTAQGGAGKAADSMPAAPGDGGGCAAAPVPAGVGTWQLVFPLAALIGVRRKGRRVSRL